MAQNKLVMCYYENWSQYRRNRPFFPEQIDVNYCTHLVYSFAKLSGNRLTTLEWNEILDYTDGLYVQTCSRVLSSHTLGGRKFQELTIMIIMKYSLSANL